MELYVVKEKIQTIQVKDAFSRSDEYTDHIEELEQKEEGRQCHGNDCRCNFLTDDLTVLTLADLPVKLSSICDGDDVNYHSEAFARRVRRMILKDKQRFGNMKLEMVMSNDVEGYFVLTGPPEESTEDSKINILKWLDRNFNYRVSKDDYKFKLKVEVSLCQLASADAAVAPESLIILKDGNMMTDYLPKRYQIGSNSPLRIPSEMKWWELKTTGFIYAKLNVKIILGSAVVNRAFDSSYEYAWLLEEDELFADLEIECKNGAILKGHRAIIASQGSALREKLENMVTVATEGKMVGPWKLKLEMSEEGVKAFLLFLYCGEMDRAVGSSELSLELFKVGREYGLKGLISGMMEIMMGKGCRDFKYFSVKGALDLFLYAREDGKKGFNEVLWDKAVRVLRNYLQTANEKILGSEEFQEFIQRQPDAAMELSGLCEQHK